MTVNYKSRIRKALSRFEADAKSWHACSWCGENFYTKRGLYLHKLRKTCREPIEVKPSMPTQEELKW